MERPSSPGSMISRMIRSGCARARAASRAAPSSAVSTPKPSRRITSATSRRMSGSSSTMRMVAGLAIMAAFIGLELLMSRLAHRDRDTHDLGESAATLGVAIGHSLLRAAGAGLLSIPFAFAYHYRLFDFSATTPLALGALFLATEFV